MAVRIGLAGGGLVAQAAHLPALQHLEGTFAVVGLADPSRAVREGVAARFGIPRVHADWRALLGDVDALIVGTPNETHAEIALAALEAGVHVLVEKPLCIAPADADRIVAAGARAGRVVQVGYMKRHSPAFAAARDALAGAGVRLVQSATTDPLLAGEPFLGPLVRAHDVPESVVAAGRAVLAEQLEAAIGVPDPAFSTLFLGALSHDVNTVLGLLGDPDADPVHGAVWADGQALAATWALPGGACWQAAFAFLPGSGRYAQRFTLHAGTETHALEFGAPYLQELPARHTRTTPSAEITSGAPHGAHRGPYVAQLEHFAECIAGRAMCATPAAQGRRDVALLARLYRECIR